MANEEWFDAVLFRPLGRAVARGLKPTPVTANQVSLASAGLGIVAAVLIGLRGGYSMLGGFVLLGMLVLDCADGELARLRGGGNWRGRMVDGLADIVTAVAVHHGIVVHLALSGLAFFGYTPHLLVWYLILALAGASFTWNSGVLDALKQRQSPHSFDNRIDEFADDVHNLWDKLLFSMLTVYTRRLKKVPDGSFAEIQFRFSWIRWVGPTAHQLWMAAAAIAALFTPYAFVVYLVITIIPANLYLLGVRWLGRHPTLHSYRC